MPYKEVVKQLKKYDSDTTVELSLNPGKKGLVEECQTRAEYEGYSVSFLASTTWRSSDLRTTEMTVGDIVALLKKKKLSKMTDRDFYGISNENSSDGDMDFSDIEWDKGTPEQIQDEASLYELYFKGDIDCDCTFNGLSSISISLIDDYITVDDEE